MSGPAKLVQWHQRVLGNYEKLKIVAVSDSVSLDAYKAKVLAESVDRAA